MPFKFLARKRKTRPTDKKGRDKQKEFDRMVDRMASPEANREMTREEYKAAYKRARAIDRLNTKAKGEKIMDNSPGNIIDVIGATKQFSNKFSVFSAITDVNLSIKRGEFVVIQGPSGSGKSTLLNILSGLDRPTVGKIIVNGINIVALKDIELTRFRRETTGFIFQSYNLLPSLNVAENAKIGQVLQSDRDRRLPLTQVLTEIGIKSQANKAINEISGGQQQRVSIARAISKNPLILFADEPTGALDEVSAKSVLTMFEKVSRHHNMTVILVTHDPRIALIADRIIRVRNGHVEAIVVNNEKISAEDL